MMMGFRVEGLLFQVQIQPRIQGRGQPAKAVPRLYVKAIMHVKTSGFLFKKIPLAFLQNSTFTMSGALLAKMGLQTEFSS